MDDPALLALQRQIHAAKTGGRRKSRSKKKKSKSKGKKGKATATDRVGSTTAAPSTMGDEEWEEVVVSGSVPVRSGSVGKLPPVSDEVPLEAMVWAPSGAALAEANFQNIATVDGGETQLKSLKLTPQRWRRPTPGRENDPSGGGVGGGGGTAGHHEYHESGSPPPPPPVPSSLFSPPLVPTTSSLTTPSRPSYGGDTPGHARHTPTRMTLLSPVSLRSAGRRGGHASGHRGHGGGHVPFFRLGTPVPLGDGVDHDEAHHLDSDAAMTALDLATVFGWNMGPVNGLR